MGNEENEIITYVIFGKREQLVQFPGTTPAVVLTGDNHRTEFRPLYLFWDKTDEAMIRILDRKSEAEKMQRKRFCGKIQELLAVKYLQNKYREVFLTNPETLFLSERAQTKIPPLLWRERVILRQEWFLGFGKKEAIRMLARTGQEVTVFYVPERDWNTENAWEWLQEAEKAGGTRLINLCIFGQPEQKDKGEDLLDRFYEETGIAGSFYNHFECRRIASITTGEVLLLDCLGMAMGALGHPDYYIDGAGVRTGKEMRRMKSACKACQSLRMQLDRAFLGAL